MSDTQVAQAPPDKETAQPPPGEGNLIVRLLRDLYHLLARLLRATEIDTRLLGMVGALVVIWVVFNIFSDGTFLTARNLWNLSVQTSVVAIMATGMVLVIVARHIDLSVGSMLGMIGMAMAILQAEFLPKHLGFDHWATWIIVLAAGIVMGAIVGGLQGAIIAYAGVPSFIVTLGGLLVWRGVALSMASGKTIAPMDGTFQLLGGGSRGSLGPGLSWVVAVVACVGVVAMLLNQRRQRRRFGFPLRAVWAEVFLGVVGCGTILVAVYVLNSYNKPPTLADGRTDVAYGLAYPVLITLAVALAMIFLATRTRFGRYVFAIGGNPEAAELGGINVRWMTVKVFMTMGILVAIAAAVQIARLNAATSGLGTLAELYVIAAAVIGGTSFTGGIGTVQGAVLGALVMQSLQSGMVLMRIDTAIQNIVVGVVLVIAVGLDTMYRKRVTT